MVTLLVVVLLLVAVFAQTGIPFRTRVLVAIGVLLVVGLFAQLARGGARDDGPGSGRVYLRPR